MGFKELLAEKAEEIQKIVYEYLPAEEGPQLTVIKAMNYGMTAGGKRLRPLLMSEVFKLFHGEGEVIKPFMAAIEMIHNYSLIHDDLPAMDNDMYRRGRLTTHAVFGETMGILAGDGLLNYAYETAAKAFDIETSAYTARALQILTKKAGIYGMVGGQTVDVESEGKRLDLYTITFIHDNKTAAMIESAMMIGAVLAKAEEKSIKTIEKIAHNIGLAFQIQDDVLDVIGNEDVLGKPVGSDDKNAKCTFVTLIGLDESKDEIKKLSDEAISLLKSIDGDTEFLENLISYLIDREY